MGTSHSEGVYEEPFLIWLSKFLLHFECKYPNVGSNNASLKDSCILRTVIYSVRQEKAGWTNWIIARCLGRSKAAVRLCWSPTVDIGNSAAKLDIGHSRMEDSYCQSNSHNTSFDYPQYAPHTCLIWLLVDDRKNGFLACSDRYTAYLSSCTLWSQITVALLSS